jgi:hypothetical protein
VYDEPPVTFASLCKQRFAFAFLLSVALAGCGAVRGSDDGGKLLPDGGMGEIEVGTGENSFIALTDGDPVTIIHGPQGGYHIWGAIRAKPGLNPKGIEVKISVLTTAGAELSLNAYRLNLTPNGEFHEWYGLLALVPEPTAVSGSEVRLHVDVKDSAGVTASDDRRVFAQGP